MDDITATRIEPTGQDTGYDRGAPSKKPPRDRPAAEKPPVPPSPEIESDDPTENIHQVDELA